jgi:fatty-acyl-CoA synthase
VPQFHVNAWGVPYSAAMSGAKLVLPGPALDGASLHGLIEAEQVTLSAGVPTVWQGLLSHVEARGLGFSSMRRTIIGGSACSAAMLHDFQDRHGVEVVHAWGMTELSPVGTVCSFKRDPRSLPVEQRQALQRKQGRAVFGVDLKIVGDDGEALPWDGRHSGELMVRGPWVVERYLNAGESPLVGGWFPTGDVATIDADGFMQITDRAKDVIKSGGEWIGSIDLENVAMSHPGIAAAACIGVRHPKWDERPLVVAVRKPGAAVEAAELLDAYDGKVARWWRPDDVVFVDALPLGATGKVLKHLLRERFRDHLIA